MLIKNWMVEDNLAEAQATRNSSTRNGAKWVDRALSFAVMSCAGRKHKQVGSFVTRMDPEERAALNRELKSHHMAHDRIG